MIYTHIYNMFLDNLQGKCAKVCSDQFVITCNDSKMKFPSDLNHDIKMLVKWGKFFYLKLHDMKMCSMLVIVLVISENRSCHAEFILTNMKIYFACLWFSSNEVAGVIGIFPYGKPGPRFNIKSLSRCSYVVLSIIKIRQSWGHLIFIMVIPILIWWPIGPIYPAHSISWLLITWRRHQMKTFSA